MLQVQSQALELVRRFLGLGGSGTSSQFTEFDDALLQQVADVSPLIVRSRTFAPTEGVYFGQFRNVHPGADAQSDSWDPYATVSAGSGYPSPVPPGFDVWILRFIATGSATGLLASARVQVTLPAAFEAFGGVGGAEFPWAVFNTDEQITGTGFMTVRAGTAASPINDISKIIQGHPLRLVRGMTVQFETVSTAAVTYTGKLLLGLFPSAFGQDIVA